MSGGDSVSDLLIRRSAVISECKLYRTRLMRTWDDSRPMLPFVLLNPSKADGEIDDQTARRGMYFSRREGFGGTWFENLYSFRATQPKELFSAAFPFGPSNSDAWDEVIEYARVFLTPIVCAWGSTCGPDGLAPASFMGRAKESRVRLVCLGRTKDGSPRHPSRLPNNQPLESFA